MFVYSDDGIADKMARPKPLIACCYSFIMAGQVIFSPALVGINR